MHRSRRPRGVSIVEWVVLLAVIAAAGLGLLRSFFPQLYGGADRAGQCIESNDGHCGGDIAGGPAVAGGDATPTATATVPGAVNSNLTAAGLINQAGAPPSTGNPWQDWWNGLVKGWNQFWQSPFGQIAGYVLTAVLLIVGAVAMIVAAATAPVWLAVVLVVGAIIGIVAGLVVLVAGVVGVATNNQTLKTIADIAGLIGTIAELPGMVYDLVLLGKNVWQGIQAFREGASFWQAFRAAFGLARDECAGGACKGMTCFVAGTPVLTPEGPRPIEALRPGDRVLSRDAGSGELAVAPVARTYVRHRQPILALAVAGAVAGAVDILEVTPDHPFWVQGRGWVHAGELDPERDRLSDGAGRALRLLSAASEPAVVTVYNLEVERTHSYFVGDAGVLVHNADYGNVPQVPRNAGQLPELPSGLTAEQISAFEKFKRTLVFKGSQLIVRNRPRVIPDSFPDFTNSFKILNQAGEGWDKIAVFTEEGPVLAFLKEHVPIDKALAQREILLDAAKDGYPVTDIQVGYYQGRPVVVDQKYLWGQTRDFDHIDKWGRSLEELQAYRRQLAALHDQLRQNGGGFVDLQWSNYPCGPGSSAACLKIHDVNDYYPPNHPLSGITNLTNQQFVERNLKLLDDAIRKLGGTPDPPPVPWWDVRHWGSSAKTNASGR